MEEANYIHCRGCGKLVHYTPANTVIFFFQDCRWYSAAQTICDFCGRRQSFFLYPNLDWELDWAVAHDLGFIIIEGKPEKHANVYEEFHEFYPDFPQERTLTALDEKQIAFLAWLLDYYGVRFFGDEEGGKL
jgi:hypothetical protein